MGAASWAAFSSAATIGSALALPLPASAYATPWSGEVRGHGQPQRHVHRAVEVEGLGHHQRLVVEHREHDVRRHPVGSGEEPVRRPGSGAVHAAPPGERDRRGDGPDLLVPEQPTLPRVGVQAADRDARPPSEHRLERGGQQLELCREPRLLQSPRHVPERQVVGRQRHLHPRTVHQHHHLAPEGSGEQLGVPHEPHPGAGDLLLRHRRGAQRVELAPKRRLHGRGDVGQLRLSAGTGRLPRGAVLRRKRGHRHPRRAVGRKRRSRLDRREPTQTGESLERRPIAEHHRHQRTAARPGVPAPGSTISGPMPEGSPSEMPTRGRPAAGAPLRSSSPPLRRCGASPCTGT